MSNVAGFSNQFFAAYTEQQLIVQERQSDLRAAVRAHEDYHPNIVAAADRLVAAKHQLEDFRAALRGGVQAPAPSAPTVAPTGFAADEIPF